MWVEYVKFNDDGSEDCEANEATTDYVVMGTPPKTMRCAECGKRRANPEVAPPEEHSELHPPESQAALDRLADEMEIEQAGRDADEGREP